MTELTMSSSERIRHASSMALLHLSRTLEPAVHSPEQDGDVVDLEALRIGVPQGLPSAPLLFNYASMRPWKN